MKIHKAVAKVKSNIFTDRDITIFLADVNDKECRCINYNQLTGKIAPGDTVVLNTTAVDLGLGTGGLHFVMDLPQDEKSEAFEGGYAMKLNYTPMQMCYSSVEGEESVHHSLFENFESLEGMPVLVGSLHSMLAPAAIAVKNLVRGIRLCYIMTDGAALPIWVSETVRELKSAGIISKTITCGNAFGGDLECVNIYSALIAAKKVAAADAVIICMGPGIIGTATKYGHRGLEQGTMVDAANTLGGTAVAIPRVSFSDSRERHCGISHHSITALAEICKTKADIALPDGLDADRCKILKQQIEAFGLDWKHNIFYVDTSGLDSLYAKESSLLNIMGRGYREDREYFLTCGAAALLVKKLL